MIRFLIRFIQGGLHRQAILDPIRVFTILFCSYTELLSLQMFPFHGVVIPLAAQHILSSFRR